MCRKLLVDGAVECCERVQPHQRNGSQQGEGRVKTVSPVVGSALAPDRGQNPDVEGPVATRNGESPVPRNGEQSPRVQPHALLQKVQERTAKPSIPDQMPRPMRVKPHLTGALQEARNGGQTPSSEGDRLPLRKMEGRSAWDGAVIGSEWEVPPQSLAFGLCPIAGQERSSASSDPQGSASAPRGQPEGTTGRGEPQPVGLSLIHISEPTRPY